MTQNYFDKETIERIRDAAKLDDIIADFTTLKASGSSQVGECPHCHASKFTYTKSKGIYKCFSGCGKSGKDAISFLMEMTGKEYYEALVYLADRYKIANSAPAPTKKKAANSRIKFRDEQLKASGIPDKYQKYHLRQDQNTEIIADRYQAGTMNTKTWTVQPGDDMIIHYLDLDGGIMKYGAKQQALTRVRWANPELHKDRNGKPIKYQSPYDSGSHLWLPNALIEAYKKDQKFETLVITEGEKKADRLCLSGVYAVGIMGIHNWTANTEMPYQFELLMKRCGIKNVVFLLDSDWEELSISNGKNVEERPNTFFKAVYKFREYFYGYITAGQNLSIYFGYGKSKAYKGADDMIVREIGTDDEASAKLQADLQTAINAKDGAGQYLCCHNITETSAYQLKSFWHLESPAKFLDKHKEALKKLPNFTFNGIRRIYNAEDDTFELAQKILPHEQFWREVKVGENTKLEFFYQGCLNFLSNRGYGLYEYKPRAFRFVQMENKVIHETDPLLIRHFMLDFITEIQNTVSGGTMIKEMLLRGGKQYFGPDNMNNLPRRQVTFNRSEKDSMYLYFQNFYWKITADTIEQRKLSELPFHIWNDQIIKFEPKLLNEPLAKITRNGDEWELEASDDFLKADIANFYFSTSFFHWNKTEEITTDDKGRARVTPRKNPEKMTSEEAQSTVKGLLSKMLAAGYMIHDYLDFGNTKAVVCMDGVETEVGKSHGGTGKSIWAKQFEHLVPMEVIDGKKKNIEEDNHLYEEVDERTKIVLFDDVRVNFNFEFLFSHITTGVTVNPKGEKRYKIAPPKFVITTNHSLNGDDNSHDRRQYNISFSDYFNRARTVGDHYGHQFFHEWDFDQWNYFYNWLATCLQHYLKYRLVNVATDDILNRRRLRQTIGENFLNWATLVFDTRKNQDGSSIGVFLNKRVEKKFLLDSYLEEYPRDSRFVDATKLKEKLQKYCEYARIDFNLPTQGERIKSNGKEYFIVSNEQYTQAMYYPAINMQDDHAKWYNQHIDKTDSIFGHEIGRYDDNR